jgi:hypothetical protein
MTRGPDVVLATSVENLAEQYMESMPRCIVCRDWPATTPMIFMGEPKGAGGVRRCAVFGVCAACWCGERFQERVEQAVTMARAEEAARWN